MSSSTKDYREDKNYHVKGQIEPVGGMGAAVICVQHKVNKKKIFVYEISSMGVVGNKVRHRNMDTANADYALRVHYPEPSQYENDPVMDFFKSHGVKV